MRNILIYRRSFIIPYNYNKNKIETARLYLLVFCFYIFLVIIIKTLLAVTCRVNFYQS